VLADFARDTLLLQLRKLFPYVAVLLVYLFTPGLCELAEAAVHFASTGDLHGSDQERHAEHGDSQGEEGECHTCICHAPAAFLVALTAAEPVPFSPDRQPAIFIRNDGASDGAISELFRPPIV
jgi:hypothetical protein